MEIVPVLFTWDRNVQLPAALVLKTVDGKQLKIGQVFLSLASIDKSGELRVLLLPSRIVTCNLIWSVNFTYLPRQKCEFSANSKPGAKESSHS